SANPRSSLRRRHGLLSRPVTRGFGSRASDYLRQVTIDGLVQRLGVVWRVRCDANSELESSHVRGLENGGKPDHEGLQRQHPGAFLKPLGFVLSTDFFAVQL